MIYSKNMALALIKVGDVSEDCIKVAIEKTVNEVAVPYTIGPIKAFCKRMGMANEKYESVSDKGALLQILRNELEQKLLSRKASMMKQGFGLLLENCFITNANNESRLDEKQLAIYLRDYPLLSDFIDNDLASYQCVKPNTKDMQQIVVAKNQQQRQTEQHAKLQSNLDRLLLVSADILGGFTRNWVRSHNSKMARKLNLMNSTRNVFSLSKQLTRLRR